MPLVTISVAWDGRNELWQFRAMDERSTRILTEEKNVLGCMASAELGPIVVYTRDGIVLLKRLLARGVQITGGPQDVDSEASVRRERSERASRLARPARRPLDAVKGIVAAVGGALIGWVIGGLWGAILGGSLGAVTGLAVGGQDG